MLSLALSFLDKLLEKLFLDAATAKITDTLDERIVRRKIAQAADVPAQTLGGYFQTEDLEEGQVKAILLSVEEAITRAGVNADMLASASLDAEKLTTMLLDTTPMPASLQQEGLDWPYRMALKIAAETLCQIGPRFADWERAAWHRSFDAFDKLLANQEDIIQTIGIDAEGEADERFAHTYRSHILRRLATIDASTLRVSSHLMLDLSTFFVESDVIESPSLPDDIEKLEPLGSLQEARASLLDRLQAQTGGERVSAESVIRAHARCAIVGLPGSGKTTLLHHLLLAITKGDLSFGSPSPLIPVLVNVRQLNQQPLPVVDDLLQLTESHIFSGTRPGFMDRQFHAGQVVLLIDGMDEIVDEQRDALYTWIEDLVSAYPKARYVVSSRPAGYQASVFQRLNFRECHLCEFSDEQIRDYVHRWTQAVEMAEGATPEEAEAESTQSADNLVTRAEQNLYVRQVAANPLLLSTLCLIQRYEGGDLPNRRVVLYQRCVEGLLFHWDNKRGLPPELIGQLPLERKMLLLRRLALHMQVEGVAEIDEDQAEAAFASALSAIGDPTHAAEILENIRDRSGLLVERRPGVYGFSHLTFQEYLAALAIQEADDARHDRFFLFGKRDDRQWREVIALYAGLAPQDAVEDFLRQLLKDGEIEALLLCGECLAAAVTPTQELKQTVIRALLGLPDEIVLTHEDRLDTVLNSQDPSVMFEEALVALEDLSRGTAFRYLSGHTDSRVITTMSRILEQDMDADSSGIWGPALMVKLVAAGESDTLIDLMRSEKGRGGTREDVIKQVVRSTEMMALRVGAVSGSGDFSGTAIQLERLIGAIADVVATWIMASDWAPSPDFDPERMSIGLRSVVTPGAGMLLRTAVLHMKLEHVEGWLQRRLSEIL